MSDNRDRVQLLDLLDEILETYGSERARWPQAARAKLAPVLEGDAEARRRLAEAEAFDRLLGAAPVLPEARQRALVSEIVAKAQRQPRMVATSEPPQRPKQNAWKQNSWIAGALAASLVMGLLVGQLPVVSSVTAMALGDQAGTQQVAQTLDVDTPWDEDLL